MTDGAVRTILGVDLASVAERTAACRLGRGPDGLRVLGVESGCTDDRIVDLAAGARVVAIDAPLGWPEPFLRAVSAYAAGDAWRWPEPIRTLPPGKEGEEARREATRLLRFRATDFDVHEKTGIWPLSVSSDLIGIVAFRAAGLCTRLRWGSPARDGSTDVIEAYPAAALQTWGIDRSGYKEPGARAKRGEILDALIRRHELEIGGFREALVADDDCLDALVAALVGDAYADKRTEPIPPEHEERARTEGWIHLPHQETDAHRG